MATNKNLLTALALALLASGAQASTLDELNALAGADPANYARVYDKNLASATEGPAQPAMTQQQLKQLMLQDLDSVRNMIAARYAPAGWKKEQFGWDLDAEIQKAKDQVNSSDSFGVKDYQQTLKTLLNTLRDYHVSVSFYSTEASYLPITVTEAGGRYYISGIGRKQLPESVFPFKIGDEITAFDGRPVGEVIAELEKQAGMDNVPHTDASMASMFLTYRAGASGTPVPQGPVTLSIKPAGASAAVNFPLTWTYTPELIAPQPYVAKGAFGLKIPMSWLATMRVDLAQNPAAATASYGLGNKDGFLPDFGEKIWEAPAASPFRAYVYKSPATGRNIGFFRLPTYTVDDPRALVKAFAALVPELQQRSDALIIDQTNNPGGLVMYLYAIASMLTDKPLTLPRHYITLTQSDVAEAIDFVKETAGAKTEADALDLLGPDMAGYPVNLALLQNWTAFYVETIKQWSSGRTITTPLPIYGIAQVTPNPTVRYTKPILILTNQLDFSGGDFFPAIMQDNRRAATFGERTAGAGGVVKNYKRENNLLGVEAIHLTATIAERAAGEPIENLGVVPDIPYAVTPADVQGGYAGYISAADAAVNGLVK